MKILFVLESYHPNIGGVETLFKSLVEELSARNHQVMVITTHPGGNVPKYESYENVRIKRYRFFNRYFFTAFAFIPVSIYAGKFDLIHTTSYNAGFPAYFAGLINRRKIIITFHEYWGKLWFKLPYFSRASQYLHYLFERMLVKVPFDKFVGVSDYTKRCLVDAGVSPQKVLRIYNGIDYTDWTPVQTTRGNSKFQFIYFGRLGISKGLNVLVNAVNLLRHRYLDFQLILILPRKPKALYKELISTISGEKLDQYIKVLHHLEKTDLLDKIRQADAVVIPSYSEGFCYSAVESVALEKNIVSSGKGSLSEVVSGKNITLESLNAEELSQALLRAINGQWQQSDIRHFHLKETVSEYLALYEKIMSE